VLGAYRVEGKVLRFEPRFLLAPGVKYRVAFRRPGPAQAPLVIDRAWSDAGGNPLKETFRKTFPVGAPDDNPPDPKTWKLSAPAANTRAPLRVTFPKSMEHALLQHRLWVTDPSGAKVPGTVTVSDQEKVWHFTPRLPGARAPTSWWPTRAWKTWRATASAGRSSWTCSARSSARSSRRRYRCRSRCDRQGGAVRRRRAEDAAGEDAPGAVAVLQFGHAAGRHLEGPPVLARARVEGRREGGGELQGGQVGASFAFRPGRVAPCSVEWAGVSHPGGANP
jgi:hypothetical protein